MKQKAFTLIELSIVLVIIGLIVGGVLVGQDLIKAAEMRSIHSDWSKFEAARHTFKLKYNCLPGDCPNATTFGLGSNGNGSKNVDHPNTNSEVWYYWVHLASADLISGSYTGADGAAGGGADAVINENAPASTRAGVGYTVLQRTPFSSTWTDVFGVQESPTTHFYVTGKDQSTGNSLTWGGAFDVFETLTFDEKYDDGLANTGSIRARANNALHDTTCTTGAAPGYAYDTSNSDGICNLIYLFWP